jgi:hypothetical protein
MEHSVELSDLALKEIAARHLGWLYKDCRLPEHDRYLQDIGPRYRGRGIFDDEDDEALSSPERANPYREGTWMHDAFSSPERANLSSKDLTSANLFSANLSRANLSRANLFNANLSVANLSDADLSDAILMGADLSGANLTGADLSGANLTGASLMGANLTSAKLAYADLTNAVYIPASEPPHPYVGNIRGLSTLRILLGQEVGLVQLRKLLQDVGLRDLEREATYSIEHARTAAWRLGHKASRLPREIQRGLIIPVSRNLPEFVAGIFRRVAFDWTTAYGLHPTRALWIIVAVWLLCIPVYFWLIVQDPRQSPHESFHGSGIYQVLPANWLYETKGDKPMMVAAPQAHRLQAENWWEDVWTAAHFSLLSAVNIGFEQFTPGDWVRRLQQHEYELQAVGWVRIIAGMQALVSVFLLAMWALTQFGRPFQ